LRVNTGNCFRIKRNFFFLFDSVEALKALEGIRVHEVERWCAGARKFWTSQSNKAQLWWE
jgi:hypothetical protein